MIESETSSDRPDENVSGTRYAQARIHFLNAFCGTYVQSRPQSDISGNHQRPTHKQMNPSQAIEYVKKHGIVLESAHGTLPNLAEAITGTRIRGGWWAHPKGKVIFRLTRAVRDSDDILVCRVMHGKITYVHRCLWPALVRLAKQGDERLGRIQEVHTSQGKHELHIVSYPRWVPADVKVLARKMSEKEAISQVGEWYLR